MVETTEFSIEPILLRIERRFAAAAAERGLALSVARCTARIRSDPPLLAQILDHLVANAIAYTSSGRVLVGTRQYAGILDIEVRDTGPGLRRAGGQKPAQRPEAAPGLGLAVVDRLVSLLRHPVRIESRPGAGTSIILRVPMGDPVDVAGKGGGEPAGRVLVVIDDEEQVLEGLRLLLEAWQFEVVAAPSEDEVIALLRRNGGRPAGIIADYRLAGGRTGTSAVSNIRGLFNALIPGIIITGDATAGRLRESRGQGVVILQKPVAPSHLHNVLAQTLGARSNMSGPPRRGAVVSE